MVGEAGFIYLFAEVDSCAIFSTTTMALNSSCFSAMVDRNSKWVYMVCLTDLGLGCEIWKSPMSVVLQTANGLKGSFLNSL